MKVYKASYDSYGDILFTTYFTSRELAEEYITTTEESYTEITHGSKDLEHWDIEEIDVIDKVN